MPILRSCYTFVLTSMLVMFMMVGVVCAAGLPNINGVSFTPSSGYVNAGGTLTVTISADAAGYTDGGTLINNTAFTTFTDNGDNTYTGIYTVTATDNSIADTATIPISIVLANAAGNSNLPHTTSPLAANSPGILQPIINSVVFSPAAGTLGIGVTLTATITADAAGYTAGAITINGKAVTGFVDNGDLTYTVTYTVASGDTNQAADSTPLSIELVHAISGARSAAYTAPLPAAPAIDAHRPVIATVPVITGVTFTPATVLGIGGILTATIATDAVGYTASAITINGSNVAASFTSIGLGKYTVTYTIAEGDVGPLPISVILDNVDVYNVSHTNASFDDMLTPTIDSIKPVITGVVFNPASGVVRAGQSLTATITADGAGYTAGTIQINGKTIASVTNTVGTTYTAIYVVAAGDTNITQGAQIPISIALKDAAGNASLAYTTSPLATVSPAINGNLADTTTTMGGATLSGSAAVATDLLGNVYIADPTVHTVTAYTAGGSLWLTVRTTSTPGPTDLNFPLKSPSGIATDAKGNVYIADTGNNRILMIVADSVTKLVTATSSIITIAGNGIAGFSGDGAIATGASLKGPTGIAIDATGIMYIADNGNNRIRKVLALKTVTNATTGITTYTAGAISTIAGNGSASTLTAYGVALSSAPAGDLYIADSGNSRILKLTKAAGTATVFAGTGIAGYSGDGGLATLAQLDQPSSVTTDGKDLYIADTMNNSVRRVSLSTGIISTRLGSLAQFAAITAPAGFAHPLSIAADAAGTLYVEDTGNKRIQLVYGSISAITDPTPPGGSYAKTQTVKLKASKAASITYDRSDDAVGFRPYSDASPIEITATTTLSFTSTDIDGNTEVTNSALYTIDTTAPTTTVSPAGGTFSTPQTVTLATSIPNELATIYYTITGTSPTTASTKYTAPLTVSKTTTLMYFAVDAAGNSEAVGSQLYTIDTVAPATTASVLSNTYSSIQSVKLTADDTKATIYFTTDGSNPTEASAKYSSSTPIVISNSTTLKYFAKDLAGNKELVKTQEYIINTLTTTASPKGGVFNSPQSVDLTSNGTGATIYYTIDGTAPAKASKTTSVYTIATPILLQSASTTVKFLSIDAKGIIEPVKSEIYTIDAVAPTTVAKCGTGANTIALEATDNADLLPRVMYSTGTSLASAGTPFIYYTAPITFINNTIVKFFASDVAGNTELMQTAYCPEVVPTAPALVVDPNPALYLQTLATGSATPNSTVYVSGTVAPFATAVTFNGNAPLTSNTTDGSFTYSTTPVALAGTLVSTAGTTTTPDTRTITVGATATTTLSIGSGNGVIGHSVKVPLTLSSGYQAAAVSINIAYDDTRLFNPTVVIAKTAAALGKIITGGSPSAGTFRIVIMDPLTATKLTPLPDGEIAYLTFTIPAVATPASYPLMVNSYSATDLSANDVPVASIVPGTNGSINIVSKPGNTGANIPVTLKNVQDALYMLLDPVAHPVDGSIDLNADGAVQIYELQQVVNSFVGL